ncbi:uncharacterized protein LOC144807840 [Lissotriton helveticus]
MNIDTSDLITPSEELLQELIEQDLRDFSTLEIHVNEEVNNPSTSTANLPVNERQRVRQLLQSDSEEGNSQTNPVSRPDPTPTVTNARPSRRRRQSQFYRRRPRTSNLATFEEGSSTGSVVEDKILKIQRLQGKDVRIIKGKIAHMSKQLGGIHSSMNRMVEALKHGNEANAEKLDRIAKSLESMCNVMKMQHKESVNRHLRLMTSLHGQNRQLSRISNSTAKMCKQNVIMQEKMNDVFVEISRGMVKGNELGHASNSSDPPGITFSKFNSAVGGQSVDPPDGAIAGSRRSIRNLKEGCLMLLEKYKHGAKALGVGWHKK